MGFWNMWLLILHLEAPGICQRHLQLNSVIDGNSSTCTAHLTALLSSAASPDV